MLKCYIIGELEIFTEKRYNDYKAFFGSYPDLWETGQTEEEAIGKLIVTLATCYADI